MIRRAKRAAVLGAATIAALTAYLLIASRDGEVIPAEVTSGAAVPPVEGMRAEWAGAEAAALREEVRGAPPAAAATGSLMVRVTYASDGAPAAHIGLSVRRAALSFVHGRLGATSGLELDPLFGTLRARTDQHGIARLTDLTPGRVDVRTDRKITPGYTVDVEAGTRQRLDVRLSGPDVRGAVVDHHGAAVTGAVIELAQWPRSEPAAVAVSGPDGRFEIRAVPSMCTIAARASGYAPSALHVVRARGGSVEDLRITLPALGGALEGTVFGPAGEPVAGAVVQLGELDDSLDTFALPGGGEGLTRWPSRARTAGDGTFRLEGCRPGDRVSLTARAGGLAPWAGTCVVVAGSVTHRSIFLAQAAACEGTVYDAAGEPVPGANVTIGRRGTLAHYRARTSMAGTYRLLGLPASEVVITADGDARGAASTTLRTVAGQTARWDPVLSPGNTLTGSVATEAGEPVPGASVRALGRDGETGKLWVRRARTDALGRFVIANCPEKAKLQVLFRKNATRLAESDDVDPRDGELRVRVAGVASPISITGTVLTPDGGPAVGAVVVPARSGRTNNPTYAADPTTGVFRIESLPAGVYSLVVHAEHHPMLRVPDREVTPGSTWHVGMLTLLRAGWLEVVLHGAADVGTPSLSVWDAAGKRRANLDPRSPRSDPLVPGRYALSVSGPRIGAQWIRFDVSDDRVSIVEVRPQPGMPHQFRLSASAGGSLADASVTIDGPDGVVHEARLTRRPGTPLELECALGPGSYVLSARAGDLRSRIEFGVQEGQEGKAHIDVELR